MQYGAVEDAAVLRILRLKWCWRTERSVHSSSAISLFDLCFSLPLLPFSPLSLMKATIWKRREHDWCSVSSSLVHSGFFSNKLEKSLCCHWQQPGWLQQCGHGEQTRTAECQHVLSSGGIIYTPSSAQLAVCHVPCTALQTESGLLRWELRFGCACNRV